MTCKGCKEKVGLDSENEYEYIHCKKKNTSAFIRYKVEVIVCDGTDDVLVWDREAADLCGSKCAKLKLEMEKDYDGYSPTLDNILETKVFVI
ncbi:hypothetical protein PIB30_047911 [Stylosanthes scabra]|uniref:Protein yippee-like n=1 Tax=Stylosanthes scabra TaxID=79078 RepID=A0ABU6SHV0_9FABA|nr:hypothetical protein [Stylosanthes scabra]